VCLHLAALHAAITLHIKLSRCVSHHVHILRANCNCNLLSHSLCYLFLCMSLLGACNVLT
jgi:hypothetical protein